MKSILVKINQELVDHIANIIKYTVFLLLEKCDKLLQCKLLFIISTKDNSV